MIDHSPSFNQFLEHDLNEIQQQAVKHKQGSLLVVAGAGSGKTRVITARIANLILNEHCDPSSIVALTFTNKAAKEMQERIRFFLGDQISVPFVGTFHSYCLRLLKTNAELLEHPFISILDSDDQQKLLSGIINKYQLGKKTSAQQLAYQISQIKNHLSNPDQIEYSYAQNPFIKQIYTAYEQEKRLSKCLDFDDLLLEALKLFKRHASFKQEFQETIRHILVDEYQDTNVVQHELLQNMAKNNKNKCVAESICVVGDEDQSIYSWRGATVANIINFKKDFPNTTVIKLEQNYRSVQPILEVANKVINHNKNRNPKNLWSNREASDRIRQAVCLSEYQEGEIIAQFLQVASRNQPLSSIAILYRTHFQSRSIEEALLRNSIPYKILGGIQFYERKEIKDLLAYLRLMVNPFDRTALFRVINTPARSLGEKFEELWQTRWDQEPFLPFNELGRKLIDEGTVAGAKKSSLLSFLSVFDNVGHTQPPSQALNHVINKIQYFTYLKKSYNEEEAQERVDNVKELIRAVEHFESQNRNTVALFLEEVALMQEHKTNDQEKKDPVILMTLHAAKGLEFHTIILAGLEEGLLPSSRSLNDLEKLEEERRLFYVGITRAKDRLLITHCRYRYTYGQMTDQLKSRFISEVPVTLAPMQDLSHATASTMKVYFADWLKAPNQSNTTRTIQTFGPSKKVITSKKPEIEIRLKKPISSKEEIEGWAKNQPVNHPTFGVGIIKSIEKRGAGSTIIEVQFKSGIKKIAKQFLKPI